MAHSCNAESPFYDRRSVKYAACDLVRGDAFKYEVLGCRSSGCRGSLRDLTTSGVMRFTYLPCGARRSRVEIAIIPMTDRITFSQFADDTAVVSEEGR